PDNIFLTQDGGALQVKLLDFGIARLDDAAKKITKTGEILGTPRYMAPELLSAERNLDGRTDTYALGVILFEALAGKPPYLAANPTDLIVAILHAKHPPLGAVCPGLLPAVEAVVARAMARAREARYATAQDLAQAYLSAAAAGPPGMKAPRAGMGTAVLGSMGADGDVPGAGGGDLELGTFSQLPQVTSGDVEAGEAEGASRRGRGGKGDTSSKAFAKTAAAPASQPPGAPSPDADGATATRKKGSARRAEGRRARASAAASGPGSTVALSDAVGRGTDESSPPGSDSFDDTTYRLPTTGGRTKLIVVGLLAGALSAGLAIGALSLFGKGEVDAGEERHRADASARGGGEDRADAAPPAIEGPPGTPPTGIDVPEVPDQPEEREGGEATGAAGTSDGPERRSSARRRGVARPSEVVAHPAAGTGIESPRSGEGTRSPTPTPTPPPVFAPTPTPPPLFAPTPAPTPAPPGPSAAELTRDARAALRDGDPRRCADLAGQAVRAGGGHAAVRLRGDCLLGAGDRAGALTAYERFCRGAPDHPSASQVRSIVESMGGHCD
ncbi:MAG: protein kinase, partial [Deltaproteobacteria bacterium]|nr:protein kinase [Deltaproteobacteria bacterium]